MMLGGLRFEGARKMDFDDNGETNLSFALKMGAYKFHRQEFCNMEVAFKCIGRKLARPFKFYRNTSTLEEIEHFKVSIATSNLQRFRVSALVWYILVTTKVSKMKLIMVMVMTMS